MHPQRRVVVIGMTRMHRTDERDVIRLIGDVREQIAHFDSALAARRKLPVGPLQKNLFVAGPIASFRMIKNHLLPMVGNQLRLGIERINVRNSATHEQENHRLGLRRKMRVARCDRVVCISLDAGSRATGIGREKLAQKTGHQHRTRDGRLHELSAISAMTRMFHDLSPGKGIDCSTAARANRLTTRRVADRPPESL